MPSQTFYWVGATAASFNSFSWDIASNWRVLVPGGGGPTANPKATLAVATRCPIGGDNVHFGRQYGVGNAYLPAPFNILSPCLFGGVTTGANKWWSGATAGGTTYDKFGNIYTTVHPSYPFAQIGGLISHSFMSQWSHHLSAVLGRTLGPWGWTGSSPYSADQEWTNANWFGSPTTLGLSAANQPNDTLYYRGNWFSMAKYPTWTRLYGVTAATGGATGSAYDGSGNSVIVTNGSSVPMPYYSPVVAGSTLPPAEGANTIYTTGLCGPYASPWWGTSYSLDDAYYSGYMATSGYWNSVGCGWISPRHLIYHNYGYVNSISFKPQASVFQPAGASANSTPLNQPTSMKKVFDIAVLYHSPTSSARIIEVDAVDQLHSYGIRILGGVTAGGGFVCAQPAGASQGASGGVQITNGTVAITPPARLGNQMDIDDLSTISTGGSMNRAVVYLGYRQAPGDASSTTITNLIAGAGATTPVEYTILGNYTNTNTYMNWGTLSFSEDIDSLAGITISNLYLYGSSEFNMANAPNLQGRTTVEINAQSNNCTIKPSAGTSLKVGNIYDELIQSFTAVSKR